MQSVAVIGIGELPQGKSTAPSPMSLHEQLVERALIDAALSLDDVDAVLTVSPRADPYLIHAAALAEHLGIRPAVAFTIEAGGAAPIAMIEVARGLIIGGTSRIVLIVAADQPLGAFGRRSYAQTLAEAGPVHPDFERPFGPSVPSLFALVARHHMDKYDTTSRQLAAVAIQDRTAAIDHPNAHFRKPLSFEQYEGGRLVADPLRLYDCAPVSDGGAAILIASSDDAPDRGRKVNVLGAGFSVNHMHLSAAASLTEFAAGMAMQQALRGARIGRNDINLALVYDCFTIAMLVNLEDLGFVPKGQAGPAFESGEFSRDGRLPVNTHGGLLSHGHPARAGGIANVVEAVVQLRGEAGRRQIADANVAMAHGMGGAFATHAVLLLGNP